LLSASIPSEFWGEVVLTVVSWLIQFHLLIVRVYLLLKNYMGMSLIFPHLEFLVVLVVARQKIRAASAGDFFFVVCLIDSLESPPSNLFKATRKPDILVLSEIRW
jgi:hypothetical protein